MAALLSIAAFSLLGHKEARFILPTLPMLLPYAALALDAWTASSSLRTAVAVAALVIANALPAVYLGAVHQRGVLDVMLWLRDQPRFASRPPTLSRSRSRSN